MNKNTYKLTAKAVNSVTDVELAFATERLLPEWHQIPDEFKRGNIYTEIAEAMFFGTKLPDGHVVIDENISADALRKCLVAHLKSFKPRHEEKIAGVGFMLSQVCKVLPLTVDAPTNSD